MPSTFEVGLPGEEARRSILRILLREQPGFARAVDCAALARRTGGYSGCDLKELCRAAAMLPVREAMTVLQHKPVTTRRRPRRVDDEGESEGGSEEEEDVEPLQVRPLTMRDFDIALEGRQPPAAAADVYGARDPARNGGGGGARGRWWTLRMRSKPWWPPQHSSSSSSSSSSDIATRAASTEISRDLRLVEINVCQPSSLNRVYMSVQIVQCARMNAHTYAYNLTYIHKLTHNL
jgi:hypothetical protein